MTKTISFDALAKRLPQTIAAIRDAGFTETPSERSTIGPVFCKGDAQVYFAHALEEDDQPIQLFFELPGSGITEMARAERDPRLAPRFTRWLSKPEYQPALAVKPAPEPTPAPAKPAKKLPGELVGHIMTDGSFKPAKPAKKAPAQKPATAEKPARRLGEKDRMIVLLAIRDAGVTGAEIMKVTGWPTASAKWECERIAKVHGARAERVGDSKPVSYRLLGMDDAFAS